MTDGRYLAIKDDPMAYLVAESLHEAVADAKRWMDTTLLDVQAEAVSAITLSNPEDGSFTLVKGADGKLAFAEPEDDKPFDDTKTWSLTGALGYLTLEDVADPSADVAALGFTTPRLFSVATTNGTQYILSVSDPIADSDERYIRIAVAFNAPPLPVSETPPEAKTEKEAATDAVAVAAEANRAAESAAEALHAKLSPWTYRIAGYKAGALASTRASLVKQPEANDQTDRTDLTDPSDQPGDVAEQPETTNPPETEDTTNEQ